MEQGLQDKVSRYMMPRRVGESVLASALRMSKLPASVGSLSVLFVNVGAFFAARVAPSREKGGERQIYGGGFPSYLLGRRGARRLHRRVSPAPRRAVTMPGTSVFAAQDMSLVGVVTGSSATDFVVQGAGAVA